MTIQDSKSTLMIVIRYIAEGMFSTHISLLDRDLHVPIAISTMRIILISLASHAVVGLRIG